MVKDEWMYDCAVWMIVINIFGSSNYVVYFLRGRQCFGSGFNMDSDPDPEGAKSTQIHGDYNFMRSV